MIHVVVSCECLAASIDQQKTLVHNGSKYPSPFRAMKLYQPPHRRNQKDSSNKDEVPRERQAPPEKRNGEINDLASSVSKLISKRSNFLKNADHRVVLLDKIRKNTLECCICMEKIRPQHYTWNCKNCYNLLHLKCAKEWSKTASGKNKEEGWRCPYCQNIEKSIPHR